MNGRLWKIWDGSFNGALSALLKKQEFLLGTQFPIRNSFREWRFAKKADLLFYCRRKQNAERKEYM